MPSPTEDLSAHDDKLVQEFKDGSASAFNELISRNAPKIYQTAYGILGNRQDAEEVAQDVFIKAHKSIHLFRGESSFYTWIQKITVNLSRNKFLWNKRHGSTVNVSVHETSSNDTEEHFDLSLPSPDKSPDILMQEAEFEKGIMDAMRSLPDKFREVMTLRHIDEMPYDKIAEVLGENIGTVKSRLSRGREALKDLLSVLR